MSAHTVLLHDGQELDDDLGAGADEDLALAALLGVVDGVERIVEDGSLDHFGGMEILDGLMAIKVSVGCEVSLQKPELKECPQYAT